MELRDDHLLHQHIRGPAIRLCEHWALVLGYTTVHPSSRSRLRYSRQLGLLDIGRPDHGVRDREGGGALRSQCEVAVCTPVDPDPVDPLASSRGTDPILIAHRNKERDN